MGVAAIVALCSPAAVAVNYDPYTSQSQVRAAAVKEAFQFAWDGYYQHAFPHDELHPISDGFSDSRSVSLCEPGKLPTY